MTFSSPQPIIYNRQRAVLALLAAAVLWSSSGLFIKLISWPAIAVLGLRGLIASGFFWWWLKRGQALPASFRFTRLQWITASCFMMAQLTYFIGNKNAPAANIIFLTYTAPIYIIPLGAWLLNERPHRSDWLAMLLIFVGMLLFLGDGFGTDGLLGNVWGVLGGIFLAGLTVGMRLQRHQDPTHSIFLGHMMGAVVGMPFALQQSWDVTTLGIIGYMGLIQIGFSFVLYSAAIKHLEALETSLLTMVEPILNPILVFWVLAELPGQLAIVGAALVLAGVLARSLAGLRTQTSGLTTLK